MSQNNPVVVSGEAPETDSEEEAPNTTIQPMKTTTIHGAVILGEDSESEHEIEVQNTSPVKTSNKFLNIEENRYHNSLLHRKLRECNLKLKFDAEFFAQATVGEATKTLRTMEQELINSQLTLQSAITSLQTLNANSSRINNKFNSVISSSFLSNIKT